VPPQAIVKVGCAVGEKRFWNTALRDGKVVTKYDFEVIAGWYQIHT
jgi:hypothetical protein